MPAPETRCYRGYDEPNGNVLHRIWVFTPKADPVAKTNSPNVGLRVLSLPGFVVR